MGAAAAAAGSEGLADGQAIARAREGDHEAFRVLVERYQGRAYRLALRVLRDEEAAKDVVQEGFIKVYRSLDRFEGRSSFYTWLYRVVMNLCIDARRKDRTDQQVEWDEEHALEASSSSPADAVSEAHQELVGPAGELERAELRGFVADAIEQLPDDARQTLLLREVEGLSYAEIAKTLSIPKGTVMSRLHHARRRVREILLASGAVDSRRGENGDEETS